MHPLSLFPQSQGWQNILGLLSGVMQEHPPLDKCRLYPVLSDNDKVTLYVECPSELAQDAWNQRYALLGVSHTCQLKGRITYRIDGQRYASVKITAENAIALTKFVVRQDFIPALPLHPEVLGDFIDLDCLPAILIYSDFNWNEVNIEYKLANTQSFFVVSQGVDRPMKYFRVKDILQLVDSSVVMETYKYQRQLLAFPENAFNRITTSKKMFIPAFGMEVSIYLMLPNAVKRYCSN
jgi:hypothetical protein